MAGPDVPISGLRMRAGEPRGCASTPRRAGVAATATHPSATTSASSARAGVMATSSANGCLAVSAQSRVVNRRCPSRRARRFSSQAPTLSRIRQAMNSNRHQRASASRHQPMNASRLRTLAQSAPLPHLPLDFVIPPRRALYLTARHARARFLEAWDLQSRRTATNPAATSPASRQLVAPESGARQRRPAQRGKAMSVELLAAAPARLAAKPRHRFVDRPAQHANRCRDAHSPCTMRPSAIAPMRSNT